MSTSDVRDVLNLPDGLSGPRPAKKQKIAAPRPNLKGLAREVQNLGGDNPIAIVPEVTQFKKRRLISRKPAARWELRPFRNSARDDQTLILRHWRREEIKKEGDATDLEDEEKPQQDVLEDSSFAKFNTQVSVPQYSDDQYRQSLQSGDWTKEETDYLMDLCRTFDLRWPLIWDRWDWNPPATNGEMNADGDESKAIIKEPERRSMEDLKARYYEVGAKMMALQKPVQYMTQPEYALHELMAHFNPQQEKQRKEFATKSLARSSEEAREEESLLLEVKRILARSERFNEERRELYNRLDYPHAETDISAFKSSTGLQTLLQNLMNADKSKKRKSLMGTDGVSPSGPPGAPPAVPETGRRDSTAASTGNRDSSATAAATPTTASKKGQQLSQAQTAQQTPQAQAPERRKLTEQEEAIYGVTHHDRLGSGPVFRTERINKLFSHKSNQQQIRINNALNELDVPNKLAMPTAATTQQYELLLGAVNSLLDARKVTDKVEAELKVEQAKKDEREAVKQANADPEGKTGESGGDAAGAPSQESEAAKGEDATSTAGAGVEKAAVSNNEVEAPASAGDSAENAGEETKADETGRPGSSGAPHKRSASVLSSVSDKSAKRQKK
jgi:DNA methyltransferase 1-associated protein 1